MADNSYKIELGVGLDKAQLQIVENTIKNLTKKDESRKIILDIDFNIKNADRLASVGREIEAIKKALKELNDIGSIGKGKKKSVLSIDSDSLKSSIDTIHKDIQKIQNAFGKIDKNKGTQSLLTTVNKIRAALEGVTKQFGELNRNLSNLSGKDFSLNLDLGLGSAKKDPVQLMRELKVLEKEAREYENYFYKVLNKTNKVDAREARNSIYDLANRVGKHDTKNYIMGLDNIMANGADSSKIAAYKEYIRVIKELAAIGTYPLSAVEKRIAESSGFVQVKNEANETKDALKEIFSGGIDATKLHQTLDDIASDLRKIQESLGQFAEGISVKNITEQFEQLSQTIERLIQNATQVKNVLGDGLDTSTPNNNGEKAIQDQKELSQVSSQTTNTIVQNEERKQQAYRETANESQRLSDETEKLKKDINFNHASIDSMKQSFQELGIAIDSVTVNLKNGELDSFTIKGTDGIERTVTATKKLDDNITKVVQSFAKAQNQADKIEFKIDTGKFDADITKVTTDFNKLSVKSNDIETDIKQLKQLFSDMKTATAANDIESLINAYVEYDRILASVNNKLDINKNKQQEANRQQKQNNRDIALADAKDALRWKIDDYLSKNTATAKQFGDTIRKIRASIDTCDDSSALKHLESQFDNVTAEAKATLKSTQTFSDRFKKQWQQYSSYLSVASVFQYAEQGLRSMFEQVKLIDSAMTELKKVTNETDAAYNKFLSNAAKRSKEIGTTIDGLVSSTADFARLGYGFEDAQGLAEVANIYAVVGDEIEGVEGATESLISTMAAFKDEMNGMSNTDFAMSIIDKFNEIGNNFSISSGGIGEALERSASSLMAANNTIDESIALITAANMVVQDPTAVGKWLADIKSGYIG